MNLRNFAKAVSITVAILMITRVYPVKAQDPTFTEVDYHNKPIVNVDVLDQGPLHPKYLYLGGYLSPASQPDYWGVNGTRVTVSFPDTPDPSVLGIGNWIAAGMYVSGMDRSWSGPVAVDWGYYAVLVLWYNGELYLDVGIYRLQEWLGGVAEISIKTWQITGVSHSTPITLTAMWMNDQYVDWYTTINGVTYNPTNSIFDMSGQDNPQPNFVVGTVNLEVYKYWTAPYYKCYYFQFGIMSPYPVDQDGWSATLSRPSYNEGGDWNLVEQAQGIGGENAFLDGGWRWGGASHREVSAICSSHEVTFFHSGYPFPDNYYLWTPQSPPDGDGGGHGGCPYVSVWDGSNYALDNNVLPRAESSNGTDVEDYYKLEQTPASKQDRYSFIISEFEQEHSYIDQVKLLAVDHASDVNIALTPEGEILTYKNPIAPTSAVDSNGMDRLSAISFIDGNVSNQATYFYGEAEDYLVLDFGQVSSDNAKLILRDDMKCMECCIDVQVLNASGEWQTVTRLAPRTYWAVEAVNLSPYGIRGQDLSVRLLWASSHRLDYVGLDTTTQDDFEVHYASLLLAVHSTQGNVESQLSNSDNIYAELLPGERTILAFRLPNNTRQARTFIFYTEGHYYTIMP